MLGSSRPGSVRIPSRRRARTGWFWCGQSAAGGPWEIGELQRRRRRRFWYAAESGPAGAVAEAAQEPRIGGRRYAEFPRPLAHRELAADRARQPDRVDLHGRPPEALPVRPGPPEAGPHALGDEAPLKLRDRSDDREHRLPQGRARIDLL